MAAWESAYKRSWKRGKLTGIVKEARERSRRCDLCPHACGVDRLAGELGRCGAGRQAKVASAGPHFGEERPISGERGSGTIFFSCCNLFCVFCQNDDISHLAAGALFSPRELALAMLRLQAAGCHNINLVTPSHVILPILESLEIAVAEGLNLPLVYNSGGYDAPSTVELLAGVVDIYMPDLKFMDPELARRYTIAPDYPAVATSAILAMQKSAGDLEVDHRGVATRGLLVRHLVLPGGTADSRAVLDFLAEKVSRHVYVNLMSQYHPCHRAREFPPLDRPLSRQEYMDVVTHARRLGLERAEIQGLWF